MQRKILVICQGQRLLPEIKSSLEQTDCEIHYAVNYQQAVDRISRFHYIMVIIDLDFSEASGIEVLRRLRQLHQMPILVLSGNATRSEEIKLLHEGADYYLPIEKTLDAERCLAYASALMRRYLSANTQEAALIQIAGFGLKLNLGIRKAFLNGENLRLTPKQFDILQLLVDRIREIVTKEELFEIAWKTNYDIYADDALKYHIREIRKKLSQHGMAHLIEIAWGVGYQISLENV